MNRYLIARNRKTLRAGIALTLTIAGTLTAPRLAHAETLNWSMGGASFDNGAAPRVAYGGTHTAWAVEVHDGQAGAGPLWYSLAHNAFANNESMPSFGGGSSFDNGYAVAIAALDDTHVIEVHQGATAAGPEWASIGTLDFVNNVVNWQSASQYDSGFAPAIAADNDNFIEVHQGGSGLNPLWYKMGSLSGGWAANGAELVINSQVIYGVNPAVTMFTTQEGTYVVIAYQQQQAASTLSYTIGTVNGSTISWSTPANYDSGYAPSLTSAPVLLVDGNSQGTSRIIEVHQGSAGSGPLWYHTALFTRSTGLLAWDANGAQYDNGFSPSISWSAARNQGIEVHQGAATPAPLWEHAFTAQTPSPYLPQVNSNWCWLASAEMTILASTDAGFSINQYSPASYECNAANLRQQTAIKNNEQVQGWNNGQYIDCCANISNPVCNHTGSVTSLLSDRSCSYQTTSGPAGWNTLQGDVQAGRAVPFNITGPSAHAMVVSGAETDGTGQNWVLVNDPASEPFAETYIAWSSGALPGYTINQTIYSVTSCH